jgi:hypothetical protein
LPAWSDGSDDGEPGDGVGDRGAVVGADEMQAEIDPAASPPEVTTPSSST